MRRGHLGDGAITDGGEDLMKTATDNDKAARTEALLRWLMSEVQDRATRTPTAAELRWLAGEARERMDSIEGAEDKR